MSNWQDELMARSGMIAPEVYDDFYGPQVSARNTHMDGQKHEKSKGHYEDQIPGELWISLKPLGFSNYELSNHGRVKNKSRKRFPKGVTINGHTVVDLKKSKTDPLNWHGEFCTNRSFRIDQLVAKVFLDAPDYFTVIHKDGDELNNRADNLEWVEVTTNRKNPTV